MLTIDNSKRDTPNASYETLTAPGRTVASAFGDYDVIAEIGEGGMGRVYKATDRKLGRLVAIKVLRSTDPFECSRFRGEAELIAMLDHPNIIKIFAIETAPDGRPYLVLEFAEGGSLDKELAGHPQEPRRAAEMMETVARAVHFAHEKGVIHRDLKPANVLRGKDKVLKLTDFGLAKEMEVSSGMTPSGAVMGTPSYMAPEQAEGKLKELGPPTDVYGLGAILYELLTGRPPFRGVNMVDTLEQVRWAEPAPPSRLVPRLHRDLGTICLMCLQKSPARRYQTAGELADDLRRWLNGETIAARPAPSWERLVRQIRRRPWEAAAISASVLLVALMVVGWVVNSQRQREREADARVRDAHDERERLLAAAKDDATGKVLAEREAQTKILNQKADEAFAVLESIRKRLSEGELKSTPGLDGLYGDLTAYYRKLIEERLRDPNADRLGLAGRTFEMGELASRSGQYETAAWGFRHAQGALHRGGHDPTHRAKAAEAAILRARAALDLGRDAEAMELAAAAQAAWDAILAPIAADQTKLREQYLARHQLAEIEHLRGEVYLRRHELTAAAAAFKESIGVRQKLLAERLTMPAEALAKLEPDRRMRPISYLRDLGRGYGWLGDVYFAEGHIARADQAYWESHDIRERVAKALELIEKPTKDELVELEKARFQLARGHMNLATLHAGHGAYATAASFTRKALAVREVLVEASPNNIEYKIDLCNNLNQTVELQLHDQAKNADAWKDAEGMVERAIKLASASDAYKLRAASSLAESHALRAELRARQGKPDAAAAAEARTRFEELCKQYPNQPNHHFRLATVLALDARLKGAAADAEPWREALAALGRAVEKGYRGKHPDAIRDLPAFAPVRDDPRFSSLLAKRRS